jgi:hypothetical protein
MVPFTFIYIFVRPIRNGHREKSTINDLTKNVATVLARRWTPPLGVSAKLSPRQQLKYLHPPTAVAAPASGQATTLRWLILILFQIPCPIRQSSPQKPSRLVVRSEYDICILFLACMVATKRI